MTMHLPLEHFSNATLQPFAKPEPINPLANPFVLKVIPFWMGGEVSRGDLTDAACLFEPTYCVRIESLLHLNCVDVEERHGPDVAYMLEGRTGLYVVVSDVESIRDGVRGKSLGYKVSKAGIAEYVIETPAGLIIFAQDMNANSNQLAA